MQTVFSSLTIPSQEFNSDFSDATEHNHFTEVARKSVANGFSLD